jgi:hypothetical protein
MALDLLAGREPRQATFATKLVIRQSARARDRGGQRADDLQR